MKPEYEIKFYPIVPSIIQETLRLHNAHMLQSETLMKRAIYPVEYNSDQSLKAWIRIRTEGSKTTLSFKKIVNPDSLDGTLENEISVNSFEDACTIVREMGFKQLSFQENTRETWALNNTIITLDRWPGLEPLLEIEGQEPNDVLNLVNLLGLDATQGTTRSIGTLYQKQYGLTATEFNTIELLTFETAHEVLKKSNVF